MVHDIRGRLFLGNRDKPRYADRCISCGIVDVLDSLLEPISVGILSDAIEAFDELPRWNAKIPDSVEPFLATHYHENPAFSRVVNSWRGLLARSCQPEAMPLLLKTFSYDSDTNSAYDAVGSVAYLLCATNSHETIRRVADSCKTLDDGFLEELRLAT